MKSVILLAITMTLFGTACVLQLSGRTPISTGTAAPTAVPGAPTGMPPTARTATPAAAGPVTLGFYDDPHDFRSFAARLDQVIRTADVQFFLENVVFEDLKCDVDFPTPPKSCIGKPRGATVQGIISGVWASEGFGLDAEGYEAFIREFLTNTDMSASDDYGDPRPELYAYGIFKPEHTASDIPRGTVQAFATRRSSGSGSGVPYPGRNVLIIHVGYDGNVWRIIRVIITPTLEQYPPVAALLDPSRLEAKEMLQYRRRWEP